MARKPGIRFHLTAEQKQQRQDAAAAQTITVRCAKCDDSHTAPFMAARKWFTAHTCA